ncbi:MAG: hypothetical protein EBZ47_03130 [Chlamydiae bacterium]|nr:hypothetical protein [Chlamydiota bacterium]
MKKFTIAYFLSLSNLCMAEQSPSASDHTLVAVRPTTEEDRIKMKQTAEEMLEEESPSFSHTTQNHPLSKASHKKPRVKSSPNPFWYTHATTPKKHWLVQANAEGTLIELEDGSGWKLSQNHRVRNWQAGDSISITANHNIFSEYNYYVVNDSTGDYVAADLILGPIANGPHTHWMIGCDRANHHLYLENGSGWTINSSDDFIFDQWEINDTIIIGKNDSWFSSFDTLLINVNMNNSIRARSY